MNKKGGMIAEAAIVFPVVITVVLMVLSVLINLYMTASTTAGEHMELRYQAGLEAETVDRTDGYRGSVPEDKYGKEAFLTQVDAEIKSGIICKTVEGGNSRVYLVDERSFIRKTDFTKNMIKMLREK